MALGVGRLPCCAGPARHIISSLGGLRLSSAQGVHQKCEDQGSETSDSKQQITKR
ncbi:unnamed protein product [Acanthoscelides obtectus]|uniref:Uncharacterized protein n=1 Tax=Acanthoscelides obtectus TaxID=200917 RepID=A0A9P0QBI1_ACAOB|nr:unnamed protein product [Acanthoscelides obtectus]CAK1685515.1 hypothetical protein AOBTE_LOCUS35471 [Acanthoscelides obtectus]